MPETQNISIDKPYVVSEDTTGLSVGSYIKLDNDLWVIYEVGKDNVKLALANGLSGAKAFGNSSEYNIDKDDSIAHYLNNDYLNSLSYKDMLIDSEWETGKYTDSYSNVDKNTALAEAGVELCSGAEGDVDAAVEAYLNGTLTSAGATCDHHDHEEGHSCGDHCGSHEEEESSCGGSCGTCGGGCGAPTPVMEGKNVGKTCRTHYRGTFNDGTQFDSSYDRGEPLEFICGVGQMIRGFDVAVAEMEVGEKVNIHLMPEEAYGMPDPNAIFTVAIAQLPGAEEVEVGQQVYLQNQYGQPFPVKVTAKDETNITFDANHEMAGKELNFEIELVEVK